MGGFITMIQAPAQSPRPGRILAHKQKAYGRDVWQHSSKLQNDVMNAGLRSSSADRTADYFAAVVTACDPRGR
jgi:hypothetical protein